MKIFLLYDDPENDLKRFVLFETTRQLNILSRGSNGYFDYIFKMFEAVAFIKEDNLTKYWKYIYASMVFTKNSENY
ncbi:hypothetical protein HZS_7400 [Henneguya salminicola]|nr:hypothetical protein HZS_7400 [Henneguya salminicola]